MPMDLSEAYLIWLLDYLTSVCREQSEIDSNSDVYQWCLVKLVFTPSSFPVCG